MEGNYHDKSRTNIVRTRLQAVGLMTYNGKPTICGIYYDETYAWGNRWRKIWVDTDFTERAAYGIPTSSSVAVNTKFTNMFTNLYIEKTTNWVNYTFIFGVMGD